jgi:hypothetical protein
VPLNKSLMTRVEMAAVTATLFESAIEWNVFEVYKSAVRNVGLLVSGRPDRIHSSGVGDN